MAVAIPNPSSTKDVIKPALHQINLPIEPFIKNELMIKLDKGKLTHYIALCLVLTLGTDDQICRLSLTPSGCPLGPLHCPLRHTGPSPLNFQPPKPAYVLQRERMQTVCKHWLRGLCKKSDACEFLHEYNLRRMPECWWYAKYGFCSAGDECLYAHPKERRVECPDYIRGFCPKGESSPILIKTDNTK
jgi:cleavage and polyadenylation specificity factor subunit 4